MTPKEKAKELLEKMISQKWEEYDPYLSAKQCALIAVDEMLSHTMNCDYVCAGHSYEFWIEVKNEIEKL